MLLMPVLSEAVTFEHLKCFETKLQYCRDSCALHQKADQIDLGALNSLAQPGSVAMQSRLQYDCHTTQPVFPGSCQNRHHNPQCSRFERWCRVSCWESWPDYCQLRAFVLQGRKRSLWLAEDLQQRVAHCLVTLLDPC